MKEFLHKNYRTILNVTKIIFVMSLMMVIFTMQGSDKITAFVTGDIPESNVGGLFSNINEPIFLIASLIFIVNVLSAGILLAFFNPNQFLVGHNQVRDFSNKEMLTNFSDSLIRAYSKISNKDYAILVLNELKKSNQSKHKALKLINFVYDKKKNVIAKVDEKVNKASEEEFKKIINLMLLKFGSFKGSAKEHFKIVLRYEIDFEVMKAMESKDIFI